MDAARGKCIHIHAFTFDVEARVSIRVDMQVPTDVG